MGCSQSRLDEEESVQLCKHRKEFIKQAVQQQTRFASGHRAYIHSLQKVSAALHDFIEEDHDERHDFLDSFIRTSTANTTAVEFVPSSATLKVNYLRPRGNPVVSVEERIQFPEMVQVEEYSPMNNFGIDGLSAMDSSFCSYYSPPSHQTSQWDFYWNPFSSMDYYGYYPTKRNVEQVLMDDETREEEEIPDLGEDEIEPEEFTGRRYFAEERTKFGINSSMDATVDGDYDDEYEEECSEEGHGRASLYALDAQTTGHAESRQKIMETDDQDGTEETSGLPFCGDRRPTSMTEVIWDLKSQFNVVCDAANDVSQFLQGEFLTPVSELHSASSCPSSSKVLLNSSSSGDRVKAYDSSNDLPEDPSMFSDSSHQSTLKRLYEWEKKLYKEVRCGERVHIAYEKNCKLFRDHDVQGDDPSSVDKTRMIIRDLHTQMLVSMHSIDVISKRIETLRDKELHHQLLQLVKGLARMWKVMAECHRTQKTILEEAITLLQRKHASISSPDPQRLSRSAFILETEVKNWRSKFETWIATQRSYLEALTSWLLRCVRSEPSSDETLPVIIELCVEWSRKLDEIDEASVLEGMDYFAASVRSLCEREVREDSRRKVGNWNVEEIEERMGEDEIGIVWGGMSVAMRSLAEFASDCWKGYCELVRLLGEVK